MWQQEDTYVIPGLKLPDSCTGLQYHTYHVTFTDFTRHHSAQSQYHVLMNGSLEQLLTSVACKRITAGECIVAGQSTHG